MTKPDLERTPRWVKIFGIAAIAVVIAFAVLHLSGLAPHGH
jgi:hypothetical protein